MSQGTVKLWNKPFLSHTGLGSNCVVFFSKMNISITKQPPFFWVDGPSSLLLLGMTLFTNCDYNPASTYLTRNIQDSFPGLFFLIYWQNWMALLNIRNALFTRPLQTQFLVSRLQPWKIEIVKWYLNAIEFLFLYSIHYSEHSNGFLTEFFICSFPGFWEFVLGKDNWPQFGSLGI